MTIQQFSISIAAATIQNLRTTSVTQTTIALAWDAYPGAMAYEVRRNGTLVLTTANTTYSNSGHTAGTSYTYAVRPVVGGSGVASAQASIVVPTVGAGTLLMFDDFNYALDRVQASATKRSILATRGYTFYKDENYSSGSNGYIYNSPSVAGYAGTLPGSGPNAMVFESRGGTEGQTDYYVQIGNGATVTDPAMASLPPDVWFQFWMYLSPSGSAPSGKWLYALPAASGTRTDYPGSVIEMPWLTTVSNQTYEPSGALNTAPTAGWYTFNTEIYNNTDPPSVGRTDWNSSTRWKLGPNLMAGDARWLRPGIWYLHKMRFSSTAARRSWEWWTRAMGTPSWTKMAEYIDGVTANFVWGSQTSHTYGFRYLRIPTTNSADSFQYVRDFAIASGESALPSYGSY